MSSQEKTKLSIASAIELSIELANETTFIGKVTLCTTDIDRLIARLAQLRATMVPKIGRAPPGPADTVALVDPLWALRIPSAADGKLFMLRHPGLGWLTVLLPAAEATRLGHLLLSDLSHHGPEERSSERPLH